MPVQTDHLADEIKEITTGLNVVRADLAGFKASVETELKYIHATANSLVKLLTRATIAILAGAAGIIWSSSALNSEVKYQGIRIDKVDQRLDKVDQRLDKVDQRLDKVDGRLGELSSEVKQQGLRLEKIEGRLDQLSAEVKQHGVGLNKVDQRFDKVDQQFGQVLQRLDQLVPKAK
jgi:DNA repair ATPase RecN